MCIYLSIAKAQVQAKVKSFLDLEGENPAPGVCVVFYPHKRVEGPTERNDVFLGDCFSSGGN